MPTPGASESAGASSSPRCAGRRSRSSPSTPARAAPAHCGGRGLLHGQAVPTMPGALDAMGRVAGEHRIAAWKVYTHAPRVYRLDDAVGEAFVAKAAELGVPRICVHKGFGADPAD